MNHLRWSGGEAFRPAVSDSVRVSEVLAVKLTSVDLCTQVTKRKGRSNLTRLPDLSISKQNVLRVEIDEDPAQSDLFEQDPVTAVCDVANDMNVRVGSSVSDVVLKRVGGLRLFPTMFWLLIFFSLFSFCSANNVSGGVDFSYTLDCTSEVETDVSAQRLLKCNGDIFHCISEIAGPTNHERFVKKCITRSPYVNSINRIELRTQRIACV